MQQKVVRKFYFFGELRCLLTLFNKIPQNIARSFCLSYIFLLYLKHLVVLATFSVKFLVDNRISSMWSRCTEDANPSSALT